MKTCRMMMVVVLGIGPTLAGCPSAEDPDGADATSGTTMGGQEGTTAADAPDTTEASEESTTSAGSTGPGGDATADDTTADDTTADTTAGDTESETETETGANNSCPDEPAFGWCGAFLPCEDDPKPKGPCAYEPVEVARCIADAGAAGERFAFDWATSIEGSGQFETGTGYRVLTDGRVLATQYDHDDLIICEGPSQLGDNADTAAFEACAAAVDEEVVECVQTLIVGLGLDEACGEEVCEEEE